mmetsp:Transcript_20767/g.37407  ORF Transcript_20767/g.37407 Transcript_20767/m.37407 type:complete len:134 (-) Transcript_20767:436-837(-)
MPTADEKLRPSSLPMLDENSAPDAHEYHEEARQAHPGNWMLRGSSETVSKLNNDSQQCWRKKPDEILLKEKEVFSRVDSEIVDGCIQGQWRCERDGRPCCHQVSAPERVMHGSYLRYGPTMQRQGKYGMSCTK